MLATVHIHHDERLAHAQFGTSFQLEEATTEQAFDRPANAILVAFRHNQIVVTCAENEYRYVCAS